MVELFPTRRRAERFASALDGDTQTADACLQELLDTATRLAAVPLVQPRAQFRDSLRERLMDAAATELPAQAATRAGTDGPSRPTARTVAEGPRAARRRRLLVTAATGLVLVGGGTGVTAASEQALPGDVLYPVKRTIEAFEMTLAQGPDREGRALLERAANRLEEADALGAGVAVGEDDVDAVEAALADFATDAAGGGELLLRSYAADGEAAHLRTLRSFTGDSHAVLADLADLLPPQAQPEVVAADETVVRLDDLAKRACPECTLSPPLVGLPTEAVSLPALGGAPPADVTGTFSPDGSHADADRRPVEGRRANHSPPPREAPGTGGEATAPALPDLRLDGPGPQQQSQQHDAAPDEGGGDDAQQSPRLEVGDVLGEAPAPAPTPPRRTREAPLPRHIDVDDLTEPLQSPVDRGHDSVQDTRERLDGLL